MVIFLCHFGEVVASLVAQMVKNLPTNAGDVGLIAGLGRFPGKENGNPLQYSRLGIPMDWQATVHGGAKSWTQLNNSKIITLMYTLYIFTHVG